MLGVLEANFKVFPCNCVDDDEFLTKVINTIPSSSKMECMMRLHIEPFYIFAILGITFENSITCFAVLIVMESKSFELDCSWWIQLEWQIGYNCILLCDEELVNHTS